MQYNNNLRQIFLPIIIALVLISGFFIGRNWGTGASHKTGSRLFIYPQSNKIDALINLIEEEYVDTIDKAEIIESVIPEILKNLDPHTVYIPKEDLQAATEDLDGNFGGIGIQFNMQNDTVLVISVISGGPSEKLGIIPGDRIITVNDSTIAGVNMHSDDIVKLLRGELETTVDVGVLRRGRNDLINFEITRSTIPIYSVDVSYMINDSIGYIKASRFGRNTYQEFLTALAKLKAHNCKNLIVDLRGNSGGYMDIAISIINEFLSKDDLIVYTQGKSNPRQDIKAIGTGACQDIGLTILIDEFSASASEIMAGAIQDNDRGLIIGRRSFGKGLVQQQIPLPDGSAIRLTISRYYTPSGRGIQKPYENGMEDYNRDILARFEHGEFFEKDSINIDKSLAFTTRNGRIVYGSGGVMPDIFIPHDTTDFSDFYYLIHDQGLLHQFALTYSDNNREQIKKYDKPDLLISYLDNQNLMATFVEYIQNKGIKFKAEQYKHSYNRVRIELYAYIARNIFDNEGFFPIYHEVDEVVKSAVYHIRQGSDKELLKPVLQQEQ